MEQEVPNLHIKELCSEAREKGWEKAVIERYGNLDQAPWIADASRADALLYSKINSDSTVLDLGCRHGVLSFAVSHLCRLTISLDKDRKYTEFVKTRSDQDKIENIVTICADMYRLPFKENSFDLIIINREIVLNTSKKEMDDLLITIYSLLKLKGQVFIGVDRSRSKIPNYFFYSKLLENRLVRFGFHIDKIILPLKEYYNFKFLADYPMNTTLDFIFDLIVTEYTATTFTDKIYRTLVKLARYAGLTKLLFRYFLLKSYLIFASRR